MAGGRQNGVGQGNSKIWDLNLKNSEQLGIKLKKCNNLDISNNWENINKDGTRIRIF